MQGMSFLILNKEGRPANHGIIAQQITPERYLCQFARAPSTCRICSLDEMMQWNLFPTDEAMNKLIATLTPEPPPPGVSSINQKGGVTAGEVKLDIGPPTQPPSTPPAKKKPSKKTVARARELINKKAKPKAKPKSKP